MLGTKRAPDKPNETGQSATTEGDNSSTMGAKKATLDAPHAACPGPRYQKGDRGCSGSHARAERRTPRLAGDGVARQPRKIDDVRPPRGTVVLLGPAGKVDRVAVREVWPARWWHGFLHLCLGFASLWWCDCQARLDKVTGTPPPRGLIYSPSARAVVPCCLPAPGQPTAGWD